ncbi:MAG: (Fe-S)-binding protein, partial [Deltaproteobacteria bacterium]|nr:(Fe-S)-binding protein [Deltaproteobacteria bacterium]
TCGACELNCGVIASQVDLITLLKKEMLKQGIPLLEPHNQLTENVLKRKTPYGGRLPGRTDWVPKDLRENISDQPDVFYFVGCVSSYMETEIPVSFLRVLDKLNIPFSVNDEEWCCGAPLYFAGQEDAVTEIARHNVALIEKSGSSTAVLTCPTCSLIFKTYYPRWLKRDLPFEVVHVTEYLNRLREEGRLTLEKKGDQKIATYHDPCHLGRGQEVYDAPRRIIDGIDGIELREMTLSGENSLCCGGGGLLPTGFPEYADEMDKKRVSAIKNLDADMLVSSCPACKENLKIAVKKSKLKTRVVDLVELIDELL